MCVRGHVCAKYIYSYGFQSKKLRKPPLSRSESSRRGHQGAVQGGTGCRRHVGPLGGAGIFLGPLATV